MLNKEHILKGRNMKQIYAGEFYITRKKGIVITTLLGSCVSVCLSDNTNSVYGINHFMLPKERSKNDNPYKYAVPATYNLIKMMFGQGADLKDLEAKIFGGAFVAKTGFPSIPEMNIKMAVDSLNKYGIEIKARDIGGIRGRQIYFCTGEHIYTRKIKVSSLVDKGKIEVAL